MQSNNPHRIPLDPKQPITVGLKWDELQGNEIDLDLQCVLMNELGQIEDAVYYNDLESKISKISLSEDSKGEKAGFDEFLSIDLQTVPYSVKYLVLMICSFKGQPLKYVESSMLQVMSKGTPIFNFSIGSFNDNVTLSCLPCIFEKSYDGSWTLAEVGLGGKGKTFLENEVLLKDGIVRIGFNADLFLECKNWTGGKSFKLEKNQSLVIPHSLKTVCVGLGWDTQCDIDSSILLFEKEQCVDEVYFGRKKNSNGSVVHGGDNLSGAGSGDDEVITMKLNDIPNNITTIWAVITIYSSQYQFDDVKGAYCRLFSSENKSEFCRFNLSQNKDGVSTGNILCSITRCQQGSWSISPKGFYTKNTNRSNQMTPIIKKVLMNDFSQVKILDASNVVQPPAGKPQLPSFNYLIQIEKASGLAAFDSNGFSDPYVVVRINGKKLGKTGTINKNLNPVWNFNLQQRLAEGDRIEFRIYDQDFLVSDDYMGSGFVDVNADFLKNNRISHELKVLNKDRQENNKFKGTLSVTLTKQN